MAFSVKLYRVVGKGKPNDSGGSRVGERQNKSQNRYLCHLRSPDR